jgi:diketogulonate reductase-like aldo/keto reductase
VAAAYQKSLEDLGLDYINLYLIHFPISLKFVHFDVRYPAEWIHGPSSNEKNMEFAPVPLHATWRAVEGLVEKGLVRIIRLSEWNAQGLRDIFSYAKLKPSVLQAS